MTRDLPADHPVNDLYLLAVAALGPEAWHRDRLAHARALVKVIDRHGGVHRILSSRVAAAELLVAAVACLLDEGAGDRTASAVIAACNVWRRKAVAPAGGELRRDFR